MSTEALLSSKLEYDEPIIGQEAVCPNGLGRVIDFKLGHVNSFIRVRTYVDNRSCEWAPHNVKLISPFSKSNR